MSTQTRAAEAAAHRLAVSYSIADIAGFLQETLGQALVAYMAGVSNGRTVGEWARGSRVPRPEADRRLRAAFQIFHTLQRDDDPFTIRAWFVGLNPQLDDVSPAEAISEDRLKDAMVAARAFLTGA